MSLEIKGTGIYWQKRKNIDVYRCSRIHEQQREGEIKREVNENRKHEQQSK